MTTEELELEKLKIVYDQVAEQHRYYLSWRQLLLAGYFAIIGVLFYSSYIVASSHEYGKWVFLIILCISFLSFLFLLLDRRNRDLYHVCQRVGSKIEQEFFNDLDSKSKDNKSLFFTLDRSQENSTHWTHSTLIDILYISVIGLTLLLSTILFLTKTIGIHLGCS